MNRSTRVIYNTKHILATSSNSSIAPTLNIQLQKKKNSINAATTWENENETETKIDQ